MKKLLFLTVLISFNSSLIFSQITIDQSDMLIEGTQITMTYDTSGPMLNFGTTGPGQVWDFTSVTNTGTYNSDVLDPSGLIKSSTFPQATAAFSRFNYITQYYENTSTELRFLGTVVTVLDTVTYDLNYNYLKYPTSLGSTHSDQSDLSLVDKLFAGFDPDGPGPHPFVDSIGYLSMELFESHIDAEGVVKTPVAEYNALRQFAKLTYIDSSYMYANNHWQHMTPSLLAMIMAPAVSIDTTYSYTWMAKKMSLPVFTIEFDPNTTGNDVLVAQWTSLIPGPIGIENVFTKFNVETYPNPITSTLNIVNNHHAALTFEIHDAMGSLVHEDILIENATLNLSSFPQGFYFLTLISDEQKEVRKFIKQ